MSGSWQILGAQTPKPSPFTTPEFLWATAGFVGVLLLGAIALAWVKRWRAGLVEKGSTPEDRLGNYRTLYEQGVISREEFEQIRGTLQRPTEDAKVPSESSGQEQEAPPPRAVRLILIDSLVAARSVCVWQQGD
jgi:hypothetical protein